jgi:hypothetical protein
MKDRKRQHVPPGGGLPNVGDKGTSETDVYASLGATGQAQGDNITYGNPVNVPTEDFSRLGLSGPITAYSMDENGNLTEEPELHQPIGGEHINLTPEQFLAHTGLDEGEQLNEAFDSNGSVTISGQGDLSVNVQRVNVGGDFVGYYVSSSNSGKGFYLDPNALNTQTMRNNGLGNLVDALHEPARASDEPATRQELPPPALASQATFSLPAL